MAVIKCKMCGGDLDIIPEENIAVCQYCGAKQTLLPEADEPVDSFEGEASGENPEHGGANNEGGSGAAEPNVKSLNERAMLFLEDGDFRQASEYFDRVLDIDPEYAPAYIGKLMVEKSVRQENELADVHAEHAASEQYLAESGHYQKALRFGDEDLKARLESYERAISDRVRQRFEEKAKRMEEITSLLSALNDDATGDRKKGWRFLSFDEMSGRILVISEDCVAWMPFQQSGDRATWETSTVRAWLNTDFYLALPSFVQSHIQEVSAPYPDDNKGGGTSTTNDKIFLLSVNEVNRFFPDNASRVARYDGRTVWWWLRSPDENDRFARYISSAGDVRDDNLRVDTAIGIRSAMWLNLDL